MAERSVGASDVCLILAVLCRVNEFNVDALVACGLPYHATNHFVRVVQILHLDQSIWRFLSPMQKSGAAMPRTLLVQRCINDQVQFIAQLDFQQHILVATIAPKVP